MPKDVIGSAYVRIVAMSQDFEKQVQASFDRLKPMAEKSGEESSKAWTDAFNKHFGQSMADAHERTMADLADEWGKTDHGEIYGDRVGDGMHERLIARQRETADALGSQWSTAGGEHGSTYADPIATSIENALAKAIENTSNLWRGSHLMDSPLSDIKKLEDEIERGLPASGRRGSVGFGQAFSNVFDSIGREISALFSSIGGDRGGNSRIFKSLTDGADQASRAFTMLFGIGQLLGSGLTVLVAGISNVVAGIFALGSAAASAAPALAVLPGLLAALVQAGAGIFAAFSGIGKALQAGFKAATPAIGSATMAARQHEAAVRAVENAARSLATAERAASSAKKDLADAQKNLNDAYKEGAKQLRDIQYAAEDAALQEERSAINLANARDELVKVKATNPADSRAVQEAELAYKEADLAYREARSRNKDASEEANDATKKGVKGSQAVVSAQERLIAAQQRVADSNQRVADAQRALADAQRELAAGGTAAARAQDQFNQALAKFGPQGQKFIKSIVGMRDTFSEIKKAAGEGIFTELNKQLAQMNRSGFLTMIKDQFEAMSPVIGGVVKSFGDFLFASDNMKALNRVMTSSTVVIQNLGPSLAAIASIFLDLADAARPVTEEFSRWLGEKFVHWSVLIRAKKDTGELTETIKKAAGVAKILGKIFSNVFGAIFSTGKAAQSGGMLMLKDLLEATDKWNKWTKSVGGQNQLKKYFEDVAPGFKSIMEGINSIVKELAKIGGDKSLTVGLGEGLKEVATWIAPVAGAVSKVMPGLVGLGKNIGTIFKALQESKALDTFVWTLEKISGVFAALLGNPVAKQFIIWGGAIMGVVRALRLVAIPLSFLMKATLGKSIKNIATGFGVIKNVFAGEDPFDGMSKGSRDAREEFEKQMRVDKLKKEAMEGVGEGAKIAAKYIDDSTKASKKSRGTKILERVGLKSPTGTHEAPKTKTPGRGRKVAGKLGKGLAIGGAALGGVGLAVGALAAVATLNKDSAAALGKQIGDMAKNLPVALSALAAQIPMILNSIAGAIGPLINTIAAALPGVINSIVKALPLVINAIMAALPKVLDAIVKIIPVLIGAITKLLPMVIQAVTTALPKIISVIVGVIPVLIRAIAKLLPIVIKALAKALPLIIKAIVGAIPLIIKALVTALPEVIKAIAQALPLIVNAVIEAVPEIIGAVIQALPLIVQAIAQALPEIWDALKGLFGTIKDAVVEAVPKVIEGLGVLIKAIGDWVTQNGPTILAKLGEWTSQFVAWIADLLAKLPGELLKVAGAIISWIAENGPKFLVKLGEWTAQFVVWVAKLIVRLPIELAKLWLKIAGWIAGIAVQIPGKIAGWITAFLGWVGDIVSKIPGKLAAIWVAIAKWIGEIPSKVTTAAANVWGGLFSGIKSAFVTALNWVINKWNSVRFPSLSIPGTDVSTPDRLPHIDPIKMALGGTVLAKQGGVLAQIAERGRNEVVKPLDAKGLTASDRLIVDMIMQQGRQLAQLVSALTTNGRPAVNPAVATTAATAAVAATERTLSTRTRSDAAATPELIMAIDHLTASVDSLQRPLIGGDLNVTSAPGEQAAISVPAALRRRAYTRPGAR